MAVMLGIDVGTSSTKTLAIDEAGNVLGEATAEYPVSRPKPGWSEQNPDDWWQATISTVQQVLKAAKLQSADVKAIGLSGQMHGSVFLDEADQVIRPAILWNDQRTAAECLEIEDKAGGKAELIRMVANPAHTGFTAPKILWLRNQEPQHFEKVRQVLLPKDEIRRRLTGEYATEVSDASGMLLLNVTDRSWSTELLGLLDLNVEMLGKLYESEDVTGKLTSQAAEALGLTTDCVVVGGAGDCAAGAVGNGIVREGVLNSSLGTSGVMFVHSEAPTTDTLGRLHTFCHAVRNKWHMMGVNLSSTDSLNWFIRTFCQADAKQAEQTGASLYDKLMQEAAQASPGSGGVFFLPYLSGERAPHADPNARGCFIGMNHSHTRAHMIRSIIEGVTFALRDSLEIIQTLNVPVEEIRLTGGGAKSAFWRQMQADVFGQTVSRTKTEQGAAYGVALLAAVGAGVFKDIQEACSAAIEVTEPNSASPDPTAQEAYNRAFPIYQHLYTALKPHFPEIAILQQ